MEKGSTRIGEEEEEKKAEKSRSSFSLSSKAFQLRNLSKDMYFSTVRSTDSVRTFN